MTRLAKLAGGAVLALALAVLGVPAHAQGDFPNRPIRLIVGFPPGTAADLSARALAPHMSQTLGQQIVVESRTGAGSSIAAEFVARAPKDGYTLFLGASANVSNAVMFSNLSFDFAKDFAPIALTDSVPVILVANPSLGLKSVQELIALAKSKPGQINYASTGIGASPHLSAELFNVRAGVKLVHIPYQGSTHAVTDLLAGRVSVMFSPASTVIPQIEAGKLVALASTTKKRLASLPNLPTMEESGLPDFETSIWFALMAPAGTPRPAIDKLAGALNAALKSDEVLASLKRQGFEPLGGTPEELARHIDNDTKKWDAVVKAAGLKK